MSNFIRIAVVSLTCGAAVGCGASDSPSPSGSSGGAGGASSNGGAVAAGGTASGGTTNPGSGGTTATTGGVTSATGGVTSGSGGAASGGAASGGAASGGAASGGAASGGAASGGAASGGAASGGAASGGAASGGSGSGGATTGGTSLTGTLGALGAVKPTVSAWVISNSGETLIYLTSAPLTCAAMQTMGAPWLKSLPAGSQVIELVVKGAPTVKSYTVGGFLGAEANYAEGGKSSSYEVNASSGSIAFTAAAANGPVDGTVTATYSGGTLSGTFHAEFCANGSQY